MKIWTGNLFFVRAARLTNMLTQFDTHVTQLERNAVSIQHARLIPDPLSFSERVLLLCLLSRSHETIDRRNCRGIF